MRLPEFLTELSPIRETLTALEQGEKAMAEDAAEKNAQVCVASADRGLGRSRVRLVTQPDVLIP